MQHGFLITCYKDIKNLNNLINDIFKIKDSRIYISADTKDDNFLKQIKSIRIKYKNNLHIYFHKMNWGSINHYNAFMKLLKIAILENCNYFHWIDGRTRIIVKPKKFLGFFEKNKKKTFIEYLKIPNKHWRMKGRGIKQFIHKILINGLINRVKYFYIIDFINMKNNKLLFIFINLLFIILQKACFINRLFYKKYYGGVGYFSFSSSAANYLYEKYKIIHNKFNNTFIAEEIISHTILLNSGKNIKKNIKNINLIYQNWDKKNNEIPAILDMDDLIKIKKNKYIFARKFDSRLAESQALHKAILVN
jgi:hypothetical protein